jgi:hypothetical protein
MANIPLPPLRGSSFFSHAHPALPGWATLCRAYGASLWFHLGTLDGTKMRPLLHEHGGHSSAAPPGLIPLFPHPPSPSGLGYIMPRLRRFPLVPPGHMGTLGDKVNMANHPLRPYGARSHFSRPPSASALGYVMPRLRRFPVVHIAPQSAAVKMPALRQQIRIPGFSPP